jgi:dienelactone hydrolase
MRHTGSGRAAIAMFLAGLAAAVVAQASPAVPLGDLIYLHGRIVQEEQSARPRSPRFGYYELNGILDAFGSRGFLVHSEIRPKAASVSDAADRVVGEVRRLLKSGHRVTVVGASMGASIALLASARLQEPKVNFCVLGICLADNVRDLRAKEGKAPSGRLLAIREASDDVIGPCAAWKNDPAVRSPLDAREIVLHTGRSHGFLYLPLREWLDPLMEWESAGQGPEERYRRAPGAGGRRAGAPRRGNGSGGR